MTRTVCPPTGIDRSTLPIWCRACSPRGCLSVNGRSPTPGPIPSGCRRWARRVAGGAGAAASADQRLLGLLTTKKRETFLKTLAALAAAADRPPPPKPSGRRRRPGPSPPSPSNRPRRKEKAKKPRNPGRRRAARHDRLSRSHNLIGSRHQAPAAAYRALWRLMIWAAVSPAQSHVRERPTPR